MPLVSEQLGKILEDAERLERRLQDLPTEEQVREWDGVPGLTDVNPEIVHAQYHLQWAAEALQKAMSKARDGGQ